MKLFGNKNSLKPLWRFSQKGNLWRFHFGGNEFIAGETRDMNTKKVYLFSLNYKTGKVYLKDFIFDEGNFLITLENVTDKFILVSEFERPEMPVHKGITALDIKTGEVIWQINSNEYLFHTGGRLFAYQQRFESTVLYEYELETGKLVREIPSEMNKEIYTLRDESSDDLFEESYNYPRAFSDDGFSESARNILQSELKNVKTFSEPEAIENKNYFIFNFYEDKGINLKDLNERNLKNIFRIYDIKNEELLYEDELNETCRFNVPDNFFIKDNYLFYLKEKQELISIQINENL
jgi:hypothetical protein